LTGIAFPLLRKTSDRGRLARLLSLRCSRHLLSPFLASFLADGRCAAPFASAPRLGSSRMKALLAEKVQSIGEQAALAACEKQPNAANPVFASGFDPLVSRCGVRRDQRVRDRLRDGPKRLQAAFSAKSPLQTAFKASTRSRHESAGVQGFLRAERRRSRTYPAWGCQTSPVLKTGWATGPMPLRPQATARLLETARSSAGEARSPGCRSPLGPSLPPAVVFRPTGR
jgi:hypothetical protein